MKHFFSVCLSVKTTCDMHVTLISTIFIIMKLQNLRNSKFLVKLYGTLEPLMETLNLTLYSYMQGSNFVEEVEMKLLEQKFS